MIWKRIKNRPSERKPERFEFYQKNFITTTNIIRKVTKEEREGDRKTYHTNVRVVT
jgi:hypothetical protein